MKGDFTRSTYLPARHYERVRLQQGRALLDADWNEQVDLTCERIETEALDVIGRCGAPLHEAGFHIVASAADLTAGESALPGNAAPAAGAALLVSAGRYYVDGILVRNESICNFTAQPDLAVPMPGTGTWIAYLEVWRRYVNALDDPRIREVALGGPDTSGRIKTVWQVRMLAVPAGTTCGAEPNAWTSLNAPSTGTLSARTVPATPATDPCTLSPGGGYSRLENQLYRVEIHKAGNLNTATFKWSRDNGSVVAGFDPVAGAVDKIKVLAVGRDKESRFAVGQWVELIDDEHELDARPGVLARVIDVKDDVLQLQRPAPLVDATQFVTNRRVRRWESADETAVTTPAANQGYLKIEDGLEIRFGAGTFRSGDYWLIPARTATGDVDWPFPAPQRPQGIDRHRCKLAIVEVGAANAITKVTDCRVLFAPLTEIDASDECCKIHNKHLHGWGVVCGLQVHCGGAAGQAVVEPGYALECDGGSLFVRERKAVPVAQLGAALLDANGDGKVCLALHKAADGAPAFDVIAEPQGRASPIEAVLQGTLFKDIREDCVKPLLAQIDAALDADNMPGDTRVVKEGQRNRIALRNLGIELLNGSGGSNVFLSRDEHNRLKKLYQRLAMLITSGTSCSLAAGLPPFPGYWSNNPFPWTAYGRAEYAGVRLHPSGKFAYAYGAPGDASLDVFDTSTGELAAQAKLPDANITVQDVLAMDDRVVVAAADAAGSYLYVFNPPAAKLLDSRRVPNVRIRRLGHPGGHDFGKHPVAAVVQGQGVFLFSSDDLRRADFSKPWDAFNATGHLSTSYFAQPQQLLAGEADAGAHSGHYTSVRAIAAGRGMSFPLQGANGQPARGDDAIELLSAPRGVNFPIHAIVDGPQGKRLLVIDAGGKTAADLLLNDDGEARLCALEDRHIECIGFGGLFRGAFIASDATAIRAQDVLPMQIAPRGMDSNARANLVAIANSVSETLTLVSLDMVTGRERFDMAAFASYRASVFNAFRFLFLALAQRVKDCACDKLLVDCPTCSPADRIILACMEFESGKIKHICASHRREVLTFPKLLYWLSAIPLIPALTQAIERFCCAYLVPKALPVKGDDFLPPKSIAPFYGAYKAAAAAPFAPRAEKMFATAGKAMLSNLVDVKVASRLHAALAGAAIEGLADDAPSYETLRREMEKMQLTHRQETEALRKELAQVHKILKAPRAGAGKKATARKGRP